MKNEHYDDSSDDLLITDTMTPLHNLICKEIEKSDGQITFAKFMEIANSNPEFGYYAQQNLQWGPLGDYETSPEIHPMYGYLWAKQISQCWQELDRPKNFSLIEIGGGSGKFMLAILTWIKTKKPELLSALDIYCLDGNEHRINEQNKLLQSHGFNTKHLLLNDWLEQKKKITGVILSNEFFDSLPVHLIKNVNGELREYYVKNNKLHLNLIEGKLSDTAINKYFKNIGITPGEGCNAEVGLIGLTLMEKFAKKIERGYIFTIDYGYEADTLFASWRYQGTLMAFKNHNPQQNILANPGRQDLTAHVDFTSLANSALKHDFNRASTVTQAEALTALGLPKIMQLSAARAANDFAKYVSERKAAENLTNLEGLGRTRILALAKNANIRRLIILQPITVNL
mgnify:CR=1 FL=1|tara:strand:+ start:6385 stop:7581 length:1197 start_codon:yes stop_codon:yes gene_type:complete